MKKLYLFAILTSLSCSKTIEDRCFIKEDEKNNYIEKKPYTAKQILEEKADYLTIATLKKFRSFDQDSVYTHETKWRMYDKAINPYDIEYKPFKDKFSEQFLCFGKQELGNNQYALGRNNLGYWLLKIENNQSFAYFLGLSFSHYYINEIQTAPIIKDGFLQIEGSLVQIIKVTGLPGHDDIQLLRMVSYLKSV